MMKSIRNQRKEVHMMKRFVLHILAACMLLTLLVPRGFATEADTPTESCGDGLTWSLEGNTLTISGSGAMKDFEGGAPCRAAQTGSTPSSSPAA